MPDLDGAHGYLTALLPLHTAPCERDDGTITSPAHAVRELLAGWPTAQHSPACAASGLQSPFAASTSTHLARFAVIDQPAFNGRTPQDAILTAANIGPPLTAEAAVDDLGRPYLLFCADFDRGRDAQTAVGDYLEELWASAPAEWAALLRHCEGWREGGRALDFARYVSECQVETTMPFNDYAVASGRGPAPAAILAPVALAAAAFLVVVASVLAVCGALPAALAWALALAVGVAAAGATAMLTIDRIARRSSPRVEGLELRTILKALDLQARFTRFALDHQGASASDLQADFRTFLQAARPGDLSSPTQPPGVVPSPGHAP